MSLRRRIAGALARSFLFARARRVAAENKINWTLPIGRWDNLFVSSYLLLTDFADGTFRQAPPERETVYESERHYGCGIAGLSPEDFRAREMRKPFWDANSADMYLGGFIRLRRLFDSLGIRPGSRLLELGCGSGWMAELFVLAGYEVVATTLVAADEAAVERRTASLRAKGLTNGLSFKLGPMENVDRLVELESFDGVYAYQALHHAFDWKETMAAAFRILKPGGWFVMAEEPNLLHIYISYRMSKMSGTREFGMSRREIVRALRGIGYREILIVSPRIDDRWHPHTIAARK